MSLKRHLSYAQGYLELGLLTEAAGELARIPVTERHQLPVLGLQMAVLHEQKRWAQLAEVAAIYVRRDPSAAEAWVTWAYATRRSHTLAAAEQILRDAEHHHPDEPTIQFNLGCYACVQGDLPAAAARVQRAIALDPKFKAAAETDPDLAGLREFGQRGLGT